MKEYNLRINFWHKEDEMYEVKFEVPDSVMLGEIEDEVISSYKNLDKKVTGDLREAMPVLLLDYICNKNGWKWKDFEYDIDINLN